MLFILMISLFSTTNYAISIGISPGRVAFDNLLRDGYAERTVRLTTNSPEELTAHFEVSGEISEWLKFEPNNASFSLSSANPYTLKVIIIPPNDTRSDSYSGKINFVTDRFGSSQGRAGSLIKAAVTLTLSAVVTDIETRECRAGAFNIDGKRKQCREAESGENEPGAENPTSGKDRCGLFNRQSFFAVVNKSRRDIQQGD